MLVKNFLLFFVSCFLLHALCFCLFIVYWRQNRIWRHFECHANGQSELTANSGSSRWNFLAKNFRNPLSRYGKSAVRGPIRGFRKIFTKIWGQGSFLYKSGFKVNCLVTIVVFLENGSKLGKMLSGGAIMAPPHDSLIVIHTGDPPVDRGAISCRFCL